MIKVYENQFSNISYSRPLSKKEKDNIDNSKLLLSHILNKNASSFLQNKYIKDEYNIFKSYNSNLRKSNMSDYKHRNNNPINKSNTNNKFPRRISLIPEINYSIKNNIFESNVNLRKNLRVKEKKNTNNDAQFLPKIDLDNDSKIIKKDGSFKIKNSKTEKSKDKQKYLRLRNNSALIPKLEKNQKSSKNVKKGKHNDLLILSPYEPSRKFKKMNTVLNLNPYLNILLDEKMSRKFEENGNNNGNKPYQNEELLYSQKINNFIFKIYKTSDSQSQSKTEAKNIDIKPTKKKICLIKPL